MTESNRFKAYLTFFGDLDPNEISTELGLEPTNAWRKGDVNEKSLYERKFSRWSLGSRLDEKLPLESQVRDVIMQLNDRYEIVASLRARFEGCLQLVAYFYSERPWFHFDEDIVAACAAMNLSLDCDFYTLYSDRREDSY